MTRTGLSSGEIDVCIVLTLCPLDVSPYDFSASRHLIQRAEESGGHAEFGEGFGGRGRWSS